MHHGPRLVTFGTLVALGLCACGSTDDHGAETSRADDWTEDTHGQDADPDYGNVFPQQEVKRLDVRIDPGNWALMLADMAELFGPFGQGEAATPGARVGGSGQAPPEATAGCEDRVDGDACTVQTGTGELTGTCQLVGTELGCVPEGMDVGGPPPPDMPGEGNLDLVERDPIWVTCTVASAGLQWLHVGIRFKGNSTLSRAWSGGSYKLPFKLDFDQFEDQYPAIDDQRFYGFKRLAFANNGMDDSLLREKAMGDLLRAAGVPSPQRAFYRVFFDVGEGAVYMGLYTMAEIPDDPMLMTQFGSTSGNLYKPDGGAATWQLGLPVNEDSFPKKTNEDEADWSDVDAAIAALHADSVDAEAWRAGLEAQLNVDGFLRWLAVNTVVQDWDTYGNMSHNYYLYGDPSDGGRLHWMPWDHNMSFGLAMGRMPPLPLDMATVGDDWPLIRFLIDDPVYEQSYRDHVRDFDASAFTVVDVQARLLEAYDLIAPYVVGSEGEQPGYTSLSSPEAFDSALEELLTHVQARHDAVTGFLETPQ
jgi:hypothetical protein